METFQGAGLAFQVRILMDTLSLCLAMDLQGGLRSFLFRFDSWQALHFISIYGVMESIEVRDASGSGSIPDRYSTLFCIHGVKDSTEVFGTSSSGSSPDGYSIFVSVV